MKDIEKPLREIITHLQVIHHRENSEDIGTACLKSRELFEIVRNGFDKLDNIIPEGQYYRYNDHWRYPTQRLCFLAALIVYLEKGILIEKDTAAEIIGSEGFFMIFLNILISYSERKISFHEFINCCHSFLVSLWLHQV